MRFFVPCWRQAPLSASPKPAETAARLERSWLVLADRRGVGEAIAGRLAEAGATQVVTLFADSADLDSPETFARRVESLPAPLGIVHAWSVDAPRFPPALRAGSLAEARKPGLHSLLFLARALAGPGEPVPCLVLAAGAHEIEGGDAVDPMGAAVLGACLALSRAHLEEDREHPRFAFRGIDLRADLDPESVVRLVRVVMEELARGSEPLVAWRGERRWLPELETLPASAEISRDRPRDRLRRGDHCLVIGSGKLGLLAAATLVRRYRARITLIDRKRPSASRLRGLEAADQAGTQAGGQGGSQAGAQAGSQAIAIAADIRDERRLAEAVDQAVARFGEIHAVVLAVEPPPGTTLRPAAEAGPDDLDLLFQPAAAGLAALEYALAGQEPSVCLALTQVPAILDGGRNPANPANPAITAADAFAASFVHRSAFPWTSVAWEAGGRPAAAGDALARLLTGDGPYRLALVREAEEDAAFRLPTAPLEVWLPNPASCDSAAAYPRRLGVHELFEAWAERFPEAVAVDSPEGLLTYGELDQRSSRKAACLRRHGVGFETVAGLTWDGSHAMVVGLLGILKAGGACLVLDPAEPEERREARARAAGARLTLGAETRDARDGVTRARGQERAERLGRAGAVEPDSPARSSQLAWAHSRWTGWEAEMETVLLEHRSLTNMTFALAQELGVGPDDRVLQLARPGSTAFLRELWMTLGTGARLCFGDPRSGQFPQTRQGAPGPELEWMLREKEITHLAARTGRLREILDAVSGDLPALRVACAFEDAWPIREPWSRPRPGLRLVRLLGTAEVAGCGLIGEVGEDDRSVILRPLPNLGACVLETGGVGAAGEGGGSGELCLGGAGLARGYAGRPDRTAERFVPSPGGADRIFRTGCPARHWPDGALEILPGPDSVPSEAVESTSKG